MTTAAADFALAHSPAMQDALTTLEQALAGHEGVMLCGEAGTGRELFARAIHMAQDGAGTTLGRLVRTAMLHSPNGRPYVVVDCGETALEQRLFGARASDAELETPGGLDVITDESLIYTALAGTLVLRHLPEMAAP